ncbi:MAG: hypothetical protein ACFFD6_04090 [Candidatus Thorarchaeota archaeon]
MKTKWMNLIAGFATFVLCISTCTTTANAEVIWDDNFNDGNYDGWTICDNAALAAQFAAYGFTESQWSAADNYLKLDQEGWGIISHPSNIAYGTWSFDIKVNETLVDSNTEFLIDFISNDLVLTTDDWDAGSRYNIHFDVMSTAETMALELRKFYDGDLTTIETYGSHVPVAGWHRINITRAEAGLFSIYHNDAEIMHVVDTDIDTSELLWLWFKDGIMIDNIVVNDEVLITNTPTTTPPPPPPFDPTLLVVIGGTAVVAIVLAIVFLKRR